MKKEKNLDANHPTKPQRLVIKKKKHATKQIKKLMKMKPIDLCLSKTEQTMSSTSHGNVISIYSMALCDL